MTTKKDLVEAHAFSRRRLVTAFLSGAPGGREVEPSRPGRTILGGVALAVLVVAGGAVAHELAPRAQSGWDQQGLVVTDHGSRYIVTRNQGQLRPVVNLTTAQLILGLQPPTTVVAQSTVDKKTPGETIGILGAPESLPTKSDFITTGWTACTADAKGIQVDLASASQVTSAAGTGALVKAGDQTWLIAESTSADGATQAYRFLLPSSAAGLEQVIFDSSVPSTMTVSQGWIDLFPQGTPLGQQGFAYPGFGGHTVLAGTSGIPANARAGDLVTDGSRHYLLMPDGWVALTDFQAAVYESTPHGGTTIHLENSSQPMTGPSSAVSLPQTQWPDRTLAAGGTTACAQLHAASGEAATVRLASPRPDSTAWPAVEPAADERPAVSVTPGKGSFFYTGSGTDTSGDQAYIVDSRGTANLLEGPSTLANLGLTGHKAPVIPDTWVKLLGTGKALDTDLALCPPDTANARAGSCAPAPSQ